MVRLNYTSLGAKGLIFDSQRVKKAHAERRAVLITHSAGRQQFLWGHKTWQRNLFFALSSLLHANIGVWVDAVHYCHTFLVTSKCVLLVHIYHAVSPSPER